MYKESFNKSVQSIRDPLQSSVPSMPANVKAPTWRCDNFRPPAGDGVFGAGCLNLSPGWFQQGHEVDISSLPSHFLMLNTIFTSN